MKEEDKPLGLGESFGDERERHSKETNLVLLLLFL